MPVVKLWAGKAYGTNTGNLFAKLEGEDHALKGTLHHNDPDAGIFVYDVTGAFDGSTLALVGKPQKPGEGMPTKVEAVARLQSNGSLEGQWQTDIGSAGTFILLPHERSPLPSPDMPIPDQMHTARHNFGPLEVDRDQLIALGDEMQRGFSKGRVTVAFGSGTETVVYLDNFKRLSIGADRTELVRLAVREPDGSGIDRSITIEFGQSVNWVQCQGISEAWTLGEREKLKREIGRLERAYITRVVSGVGINQFMAVCTIIFLPSLDSFKDRAILMTAVIALAWSVIWLHNRYLPHAAIYLSKRKEGWLARVLPSVFSWVIGIAASVIAGLLGAYLKGVLSLPGQ